VKGNFESVVFGATGMIGSFLLDFIVQAPSKSKILVLNRTLQQYGHDRIVELIVDTNILNTKYEELSIENCFICLGTTMKKAGSKEAFIKIDKDLILNCATFAKNHHVQNIFLVSAVGADRESSIFYNQVKGMTERGLISLNFTGTHIFRPSLLLGKRKESRLAENLGVRIAKILDPVIGVFMGKYRSIMAEDVANSMYLISKQKNNSGIHYYHYKEIQESINK
jgi:uncharacterized protein YbjT (DUF2867 family)